MRRWLLAFLLAATPAIAAPVLIARPDVAPGVAAFPRLRAVPADHAAARINAALAAGDRRVRAIAASCGHWTRGVAVRARGPRYLTVLARDSWYCGAYPDTDIVALTYDLGSGAPVNWAGLLGPRVVAAAKLDTAGDGTRVGAAVSAPLARWYARAALAAPGVPKACAPVLGTAGLGFQLWIDARAHGLGIAAAGLAHVVAVCGPSLVVPAAALRAMGARPAILAALAAARP